MMQNAPSESPTGPNRSRGSGAAFFFRNTCIASVLAIEDPAAIRIAEGNPPDPSNPESRLSIQAIARRHEFCLEPLARSKILYQLH